MVTPDMISNGTVDGRMPHGNGEIHQPRAIKPVNESMSRAFAQDLRPADTGYSSERATPIPDGAPPSIKATSAVRHELRQQSKRRMFPTIAYESRVSYFDPKSSYSNFRGFFVLFWIGLAIMVITAMLRNLKETGTLLNLKQWPLFTKDIYELALSDTLMCTSIGLSLPLHLIYKNGPSFLKWRNAGMPLQSVFQIGWLLFWCSWPFLRDWTWTAQVFFTLHLLSMFMKMHSYAFYNGHLSTTLDRLKALDQPITAQTPTTAVVRYPKVSDSLLLHDEKDEKDDDHGAADEETEHDDNNSPIFQLREDLARELTSPMGRVTYPENLTISNLCDYLLCPTLCYEIEYPRVSRIDPLELFYKTLAVFGCISLMAVTSEEFIIPVLDESEYRLHRPGISREDQSLIFAETVSRLLFPFMVTFLLVFLVIFEYVLGAFAEITRFGDRQFYTDWWNSSDWLSFSRNWNVPVHHFFHRHVYSASRSTFSKPLATVITFLISALAHELVMGCITRKFRGYGFGLMMLQIPLVSIQKSPWVRKRHLLNNVLFWCSMILGLSLMCALYVLV